MPEHAAEADELGFHRLIVCPDCGAEVKVEHIENGNTRYTCENCGQEYEETPCPF